MALKLKLDGDGHAVLRDGKPVYVDDVAGDELAFDAEQMRSKISELNQESKQHRLSAKEKAELLERFGDAKPEDVAALRATLVELGGPDGLAKLKETAKTDVEAIKKSITEAYEAKLAESNGKIDQLTARERQLLVGNGFATSKYLEKTIFKDTRDVAESYLGKHFKVEDGKPVAYIGESILLSKERPGEPAGIDEALAIIIGQHPQRDSFMLGSGGGSGTPPGSGSGAGFGSIKSRSDFKSDADKSKFISENGLDAFKALPAQ